MYKLVDSVYGSEGQCIWVVGIEHSALDRRCLGFYFIIPGRAVYLNLSRVSA
jgi:hypothetical protein